MKFCIAGTFTKALGKLTSQEQTSVKITVFDIQQNPSSPGLRFHRVYNSKDQHFWSVRINRDLRIIIHKTKDSFLLCYVGHHDDAYLWAERRRIETHPHTGATQIVEVRELVEEIPAVVYSHDKPNMLQDTGVNPAFYSPVLFNELSSEDLLEVGVPTDWINDVLTASEDKFLDLATHIPSEAVEALFDYIFTGILKVPNFENVSGDPLEHPDAQRRFRIMDNIEELELALQYPWDQWAVFLHPAQRKVIDLVYNGPARVSGSAGTGKTVVALHRAAHILQTTLDAKILLTTFSRPLANALKSKLATLIGNELDLENKITVLSFEDIANDLFTLVEGYHPRLAKRKHIDSALKQAKENIGLVGFTERFLLSEWLHVVDAWQILDLEGYRKVPRLGRKNRLGQKQRERIWPVFVKARDILQGQGLHTWPAVFGKVSEYYLQRIHKPFSHIIVDEAQDLGVPELKMIAAVSDKEPGSLFFAGDLGQRIFQEPFSWKALGIDVRGRSTMLRVNYRTSHQIREAVDRLLPDIIRDVDGIEEDRSGTVSVFNGPSPNIQTFSSQEREIEAVASIVGALLDKGFLAEDIGVFVRSSNELHRAREAVKAAKQKSLELSARVENRTGRISIGSMHLAKGLEFKCVIVMACDDEVLPNQERIEAVADETELDEVYDTERHLFYVACTRARESLNITGVLPSSEFLEDIL